MTWMLPFLALGMLAGSPLITESRPAWATEPAPEPGPEGAGFARVPIRLDPRQRQLIGLTYGTVERRPAEKVIHTVGRFEYDERKVAEVTLKVGGWIHELFADYTGQPVRRGQPLLSIYSPDLFTAQQEYLLALDTRAQLRESHVPGARESADALVRASRQRLRLWDLSEQQVRALEESREPKLYQTILSPISGVVIEKTALLGHAVQPGMTLYKIADLSTIWVYADLYEYELPLVREGQEARIRTAYYPQELRARVGYVYPYLDPKTRTARVRFEVANTDGQPLRPDMYGNVEITVPLGERLVVPETAILDSGRRQVVFIDAGDGLLTPREVRLGQRLEDQVEVLEGLAPGQRVVTSANFLVDSESKLQAAESMMGMMGALGMGGVKMETARPMTEMAPGAGPGPEEKQVGELRVAVLPAKEPATVGKNAIRVRVRDATGNPVTGATVSFTYTMDMPGMTIEEARAREVEAGVYEASTNFTMGGPWSLVVQVERPGKPPLREKFTVRVST